MYADDVDVATNWPKPNTGPVSTSPNNKNMAVAPDGSVFVTGQVTTDPGGFVQLALWRYAADGTLTMFKTWKPNPYAKHPAGVAVASDGTGGVYVAGTFNTPMQGTDIVVLHYDANGAGGPRSVPSTARATATITPSPSPPTSPATAGSAASRRAPAPARIISYAATAPAAH